MENLKKKKEDHLKQLMETAWALDCNGGHGYYHSSAFTDEKGVLPSIKKDIEDENVSLKAFENKFKDTL